MDQDQCIWCFRRHTFIGSLWMYFLKHKSEHLGGFDCELGLKSVLFVELIKAIRAMEYALNQNCSILWLENDSKSVITTYRKSFVVCWKLRNIWNNYILTYEKFLIFDNTFRRKRIIVQIN